MTAVTQIPPPVGGYNATRWTLSVYVREAENIGQTEGAKPYVFATAALEKLLGEFGQLSVNVHRGPGKVRVAITAVAAGEGPDEKIAEEIFAYTFRVARVDVVKAPIRL